MLRNKRWVWAALAVFLLAGVALLVSVVTAPRSISAALLPTAEYLEQNPLPTPEFISKWSNKGNRLWVDVSQRPFARVELSVDEVRRHIIEREQLTIDGSMIRPTGNIFSYLTLSCANSACYGGAITFPFDIGYLSSGLHLAEFTITDLDGVEHSYTWAFRYDANFPTSDPAALPTLMILPTKTPTATP